MPTSTLYHALFPLDRCLTVRDALTRCPADVTESKLRAALTAGALPRADFGVSDVLIHPADLAWWLEQRATRRR